MASLRTELRSRAILGPAGRFECAMIRPSPPATRMLLRAEQWNVQPDCAVSLGLNRCPLLRRAALVLHTGVGHLMGVDLPDNLGFVSDSLCERPSQRKQRCAEPVRHGPEDSSAQPCNVLRQHGAQDVSPCTRLRTLQSPVCSITGGWATLSLKNINNSNFTQQNAFVSQKRISKTKKMLAAAPLWLKNH